MVTIGGGMDGISHPLGCGATQIGGGADGVDPRGTPVIVKLSWTRMGTEWTLWLQSRLGKTLSGKQHCGYGVLRQMMKDCMMRVSGVGTM